MGGHRQDDDRYAGLVHRADLAAVGAVPAAVGRLRIGLHEVLHQPAVPVGPFLEAVLRVDAGVGVHGVRRVVVAVEEVDGRLEVLFEVFDRGGQVLLGFGGVVVVFAGQDQNAD